MPYYDKVNGQKSSAQKRGEAEKRGGFDDEGAQYSGARKAGGTRRTSSAGGAARTYTRKPDGEKRSYARKTEGGSGAPKRAYGKPAAGGEKRPYTRKTEGGEGAPRRSYGNASAGGEKRPYTRKAEGGEGYPKRTYAKPAFDGEKRPYTRKAEGGDGAPRRSYDKSPSGGRPAPKYGKTPAWSEPRFAPRTANPYRSRGEGITPKPYGEQKREQNAEGIRPEPYAYRPVTPLEEDMSENLLSGRNPIREALKSGRDIEKLLVAKGELSGSAKEIVAMAREARVPVQEVDRVRLDAITPHHQGMLAFASAYQYHTVEEMLALAKERNEQPFLVMLDGVTDPHNLGAVIRTAECAGAHGVIVQERRAVGLTPAAVKASAGAIEHIMVSRVVNLTSTLDMLKKQGVWAYAADAKGEDYLSVDYSGGVVIVVGAEGEGVSRLVMEQCDKIVALPIRGKIDSLNASVAAGILLYAVLRSR